MTKLTRERGRLRASVAYLQSQDTKLSNALNTIIDQIENLNNRLEPIEHARSVSAAEALNAPVIPSSFAYSLASRENIAFTWTPADNRSIFFELRQGTDWDTANFVVRTTSYGAVVEPKLAGTYRYLLKSISSTGVYSVAFALVDVVITGVGTTVLSAQVIDNNVLLRWSEPVATWWIDFYEVWKTVNLVRSKIGEITGIFSNVFEQAGGTYLYEVIAYDIAGNASPSATVEATVNNPPDFASVDEEIYDSSTATLTAAVYDASVDKIFAPINLTESFEDHFLSNPTATPWASPQEQIDDGYTLWIQDNPTGTPAAVIEFPESDFGAEYESVIAAIQYGYEFLTSPDEPTINLYVRVADSSHVFGSYVLGNNQFLAGPVQYVQLKIEIDNASADSMLAIYNVRLSLNVKREMDSGILYADASDLNGTRLYWDGIVHPGYANTSKAYKSVPEIIPGTREVQPMDVVYDDSNPLYINVLLYDSGGIRQSGYVNWHLRGIV